MARQPRRRKAAEIALPRALEVAWGGGVRAGKGPRPGLTLAKIVEAGVRIAASEGLAAVSMSRVASEVGAATMSLYRYVGAKDELLALRNALHRLRESLVVDRVESVEVLQRDFLRRQQ